MVKLMARNGRILPAIEPVESIRPGKAGRQLRQFCNN